MGVENLPRPKPGLCCSLPALSSTKPAVREEWLQLLFDLVSWWPLLVAYTLHTESLANSYRNSPSTFQGSGESDVDEPSEGERALR